MPRFSCASLLLAVLLFAASPAQANDAIRVAVDSATLVKMPDRVGTLIVGNPLIADVTVQAGGTLVITGKGYGSTNLIALDRQGAVLLEKPILVEGPRDQLVTVFRGVDRETYSCAPRCERRITLGDGAEYFNATAAQSAARNAQAQGAQAAQAAPAR